MKHGPSRRQDTDSRIMFDADSCLELRPAPSACGKCGSACPVSAFEWTESGAFAAERCLGCGQCASACPAGALSVRGFAIDLTARPPREASIRIECARVPERIRGDAICVPCLGGMSKHELVNLCAVSDGRPLQLIDRGWCGACPAGGTAFCGSHAVEEASAVLGAIGCPENTWPRIDRVHTSLALALAMRSDSDPEPMGRRAFFTALVKRGASAAPVKPAQRARAGRTGQQASPLIRRTRRRFANSIRSLAAEAGMRIPATVFPQVRVAAGCGHNRLCASVCPSGALRRYHDDDGTTGLEFEAELCIACGACSERCPSRAVHLRPAGAPGDRLPDAPTRLTRFATRRCSRCSENFIGAAGETECESCKTGRALVASLFPVFSREPNRTAEKDLH